MEAMKTTTRIVNSTSDVLKLKVGGQQHFTELATIDKQGHHDVLVNPNETYREFLLQAIDASSGNERSAVVSSDDCCDYECITIKELPGSGKFEAHRVARNHGQVAESEAKVVKLKSTWFGTLGGFERCGVRSN